MDTDVLIIGAGPTGMTLANELRVAGVSTVLVDKLAARSMLSKAGGVQSRTQEAFDQRGLLEPLLATGNHQISTAHFAGIPLPLTRDRHRQPWRSIPQVVVEGVLEDHLAAHDIHVRRNHELIALTQNDKSVTATFADGVVIEAGYVVAADGAHSTVRSLLHAEFPGSPGTVTVVAADVRLDGDAPALSHSWSDDGHWAQIFPLGTDPEGRPLHRLALGGPGRSLSREVPVTEDEIRAGLSSVFGSQVKLLELRYARRITNAARQAARYRHGRVFLAGDAAHVHLPIGAQGMNTGIQDALNLGWKLAAAVNNWAPAHLLDTYHTERHPVAAAVLRNVQAQSLLMDWEGTRAPDITAAKSLFASLATLPEVQYHLDDTLSGMGIRYPFPATHPSTGLPAPNLPIGPTHLNTLLHPARPLLLDPTNTLAETAAPWSPLLTRITHPTPHAPMLIRPDGYIAWTTDPTHNTDPLEPALTHWFGKP
ncbi:FAD-dependent monooxygenase [Nocardia sp. NPDC020380]|uniref:FAD-dependent monooxygenase n=1 Tax=Nocardia sp. NPDC020380 TaxID=3364309 RepID=UPI0037BCAD6D